ncbi:MAG: sterol desaturase [Alphaproteobacteria bacterium CG1_02_46_17]|nr:MAG: sterol desaturase [Alphaproteobacteria bacterium CG1_02_46_17]
MDTAIRLSVFAFVFICVATAEALWPRRKQSLGKQKRWPHNIGIAVLNALAVRFFLPFSLAAFALFVNQNQWGVLPWLHMPFWADICLSLILFDLIIYGQHILFHKAPALWRLHRVHHADTEIDVTTAIRFHPIEIFISMGIKFAAVIVIGAPPEAVLLFEIILNACAMFNHGNLRLPQKIDNILRRILVTPDMHRVHHSAIMEETNSNYGFNIPLWDRLFGTYCAQPSLGHEGMRIGLDDFRDPVEANLDKLLTQPFRQSIKSHM